MNNEEMQNSYIQRYLSVIEAKINTLLSAKVYLRAQDDSDDENTEQASVAKAIKLVIGETEKPKQIRSDNIIRTLDANLNHPECSNQNIEPFSLNLLFIQQLRLDEYPDWSGF